MSSFQILTCCRAPTPWAARGLKRAEPTSTWEPGCPKTSFTSLPSECPHAVRVSGESNPDLPIQSPARYLCATAAGPYKDIMGNSVGSQLLSGMEIMGRSVGSPLNCPLLNSKWKPSLIHMQDICSTCLTIRDRAFILHTCIACDKTFQMVP